MTTLTRHRPVGRAVGASLALALVWVVATVARPASTFHLAPLLVSAAVPLVVAMDDREAEAPSLVVLGAIGAALALIMTLVLSAAGRLEGPSLLAFGGAATESAVFSLAGPAAGVLLAATRRRRR
ncbi:MAG: hypothetical protein R3246_14970 [Acidimicrobiia bacterium]|nr:hypothetical protein [Acidimicrobiia bacterium]